jgi:hypothetical protein
MAAVTHNSSKQTTLIRSNKTQVYFNSVGYRYMYAACFGLYLGQPQACQYKNLTKEDTIWISGVPFYSHSIILNHKIYNIKKQGPTNS